MIDYKLLAKSIDYYESFGFKRVESPWTVTEAVGGHYKASWGTCKQTSAR